MSKDKLRIAILSRQTSRGSAQVLKAAFLSAGLEAELINTLDLSLSVDVGALTMHHGDQILGQYGGVLARIGHGITAHGVAVLRHFELQGVPTIPTSHALLRSRQKFEALQHLSAAGLPVPQTTYVHRAQDVDDAISRLGGAPLIVKVVEGTGGQGVILADTDRSANAIASALIQSKRPILLQRFVAESSGRDTRVFVVGNEVIAAAARQAQPGEYRSNVHLGATAARVEVDDEVREVAVAAVKCLGLEIGGVDVLAGRDGPVILEVNSSPGIVGFAETTGIDIASVVVQHVKKRILSQL